MSLTIPNPTNLSVSLGAVSDIAISNFPSAITHTQAGGLMFKRDAAGTAATDADGDKWSPIGFGTPEHFGAVSGGVIDSLAQLQAWVDWAYTISTGRGEFSGAYDGQIVLDFGGNVYAISAPLVFPGRRNIVVQNCHLFAIGTGWTSTDYMFENHASWSSFYNITIDCNRLANGVYENGGRTRWFSPKITRMSPDWTSRGFWVKNAGAGDIEISNAWVSQWITSDPEYSDVTKLTAELIRIDDSDCKIFNSNINWGKVCYAGGNGVHLLYNCHLVNGKGELSASNPTLATDPLLIEWAKDAGGGELWLMNCYLDNGVCNFYRDRVNLDVILLSDGDDVILTDGMLRFIANTNNKELRATGRLRFAEWTDSAHSLISLVDVDASNDWNVDNQTLAADFNTRVSPTTAQETMIDLGSKHFFYAFDAASQAHRFHSTTTMGVNNMGLSFPALSTEPLVAQNGSQARSDGTASTNGFGTAGAGIYQKISGTWAAI